MYWEYYVAFSPHTTMQWYFTDEVSTVLARGGGSCFHLWRVQGDTEGITDVVGLCEKRSGGVQGRPNFIIYNYEIRLYRYKNIAVILMICAVSYNTFCSRGEVNCGHH